MYNTSPPPIVACHVSTPRRLASVLVRLHTPTAVQCITLLSQLTKIIIKYRHRVFYKNFLWHIELKLRCVQACWHCYPVSNTVQFTLWTRCVVFNPQDFAINYVCIFLVILLQCYIRWKEISNCYACLAVTCFIVTCYCSAAAAIRPTRNTYRDALLSI